MTPDGAFDRRLTTWLDEDAAPRAPQGFDDVVAKSVDQKRQLPSWATPERWISMRTRAQLGIMPRALILILTLSLLAAALAASLAVAGAITNANDGGDPLAGLTYHLEGAVYQHPTDGTGDPVRLTGEDEVANTSYWSPDGTRFAYLSWPDAQPPPTVMIRDADGSNPVVIGEGAFPPPAFAWSPDGSRILFWAGGLDVVDEEPGCGNPGSFCGQRIWSAASDGSESAAVVGDPALDARSPVWTPDGMSIIFAGSVAGSGTDYGIYRMEADGANVQRIGDLKGDGFSLFGAAISPDGTTLAVSIGTGDDDIHLVDLATGEDVLIAGEDEDEFGPVWSPDGSLIAYTSLGGFGDMDETMFYDVASGETVSLGESLSVNGWSQDGRYIISNVDGVLAVVDVTDPTAPVVTEVEGVTEVGDPSWQPRP